MLHALVALSLLPTLTVSAPPRARKSKAKTGTLVVAALPWAKCRIDGGPTKTTRIQETLRRGEHTVVCTRQKLTKEQAVTVEAGATTKVVFDMNDASTQGATVTRDGQPVAPGKPSKQKKRGGKTGTLVVKGLPWAKCLVDGQRLTTRFELQLRPGTYEVACQRMKLEKTQTATIKAGATTELVFDMKGE